VVDKLGFVVFPWGDFSLPSPREGLGMGAEKRATFWKREAKIMTKPGMLYEPTPALPWKGREPGSWLIFSLLWFFLGGIFGVPKLVTLWRD